MEALCVRTEAVREPILNLPRTYLYPYFYGELRLHYYIMTSSFGDEPFAHCELFFYSLLLWLSFETHQGIYR